MTKPREVELWPCDYSAACLAPWCRGRAAVVVRYIDDEPQCVACLSAPDSPFLRE